VALGPPLFKKTVSFLCVRTKLFPLEVEREVALTILAGVRCHAIKALDGVVGQFRSRSKALEVLNQTEVKRISGSRVAVCTQVRPHEL
jgi:hypothetical protein